MGIDGKSSESTCQRTLLIAENDVLVFDIRIGDKDIAEKVRIALT